MRLGTMVGISMFTLLAACAADTTEGSSSADVVARQYRTALDRPLSPGIAVPNVAELNRTLDAVTEQETVGLEAGATRTDSSGCSVVLYTSTATTRVVQRVTCTPATDGSRRMSIVRIYDSPTATPIKLWADYNLDGRADTFSEVAGPIVEATDTDFDGRVDLLIESVESIGGTMDLKLFGDGWALEEGATFANRIRQDEDRDGVFETESVTARRHAEGIVGFVR